MPVHLWIFFGGCGFFLIWAAVQMFQIFRNPGFADPSQPKQPNSAGVAYSYTVAMSPAKKESAFLHYPTYVAGIIYHIGTFLSLIWIVVHVIKINIPDFIITVSFIFLILSSLCGAGIFIKRIVKPQMRSTSTPDDYFSNILVTVFQIISAAALSRAEVVPSLIGYTGILLFYIPVSKLRHAMYFFFARYFLGIFYGKRGVWPPGKQPA
jgi:hypothetical protein